MIIGDMFFLRGDYLAIFAILIETYLIFLIIHEFNKARKSFITSENLQLRMEQCINDPKINDDILATELIELIGTQRSTETIRKTLRQGIFSSEEKIRYLANLGPAVGLFFTFLGMFLTVLSISSYPNEIDTNIIEINFANLYPVFLGGALGIAVYALGTILLNILQTKYNFIESELLKTFLIFESTHDPKQPKSLEDAYKKLLQPLNKLFYRLDALNLKFDKISENTENLILNFAEKTNNFIDGINEKESQLSSNFKDLSNKIENLILNFAEKINSFIELIDEKVSQLCTKFNYNLDVLESSLNKIAEVYTIFSDSSEKWKESANSLMSLSQVILESERKLQNLVRISEDILKLTDSMDKNSQNINKLVTWVEQERLEFDRLKDEMIKFINTLQNFVTKIDEFNMEIVSTRESLNNKLSEVINKLLTSSNSSDLLVELQKNTLDHIKEISISLAKISNDGSAEKLFESINKPLAPSNLTINSTEGLKDVINYLQEIHLLLNKVFNKQLKNNRTVTQKMRNNPEKQTNKKSFFQKLIEFFTRI